MRDLANELPKPMLRVRGKPILEHILCAIVDAGVNEICIVTGHRAEVIETYLGTGSQFGAKITYARQLEQNGTGKAPELAKDFVGTSPFLLVYGDIIVSPETYKHVISRFNEPKYTGLITARHGEDISKGGLLVFNDAFELQCILEKPTEAQVAELRKSGLLKPSSPLWYNAGIYVLTPVLFEFTAKLEKSPRGEFELTDALNAMVRTGHKIVGFELAGFWADVRDPETLAKLQTTPL